MISVKQLMLACAEHMKAPGASINDPVVFVNSDNEDKATLYNKFSIQPISKKIQEKTICHMEIRIGSWITPEKYNEK